MTTEEYRTAEQFQEILDSMYNGNWTQAAKECVEYGFYANDLLNAYDTAFNGEVEVETLRDFVELIEMATKLRYQGDK